jgi:hypothetical protein
MNVTQKAFEAGLVIDVVDARTRFTPDRRRDKRHWNYAALDLFETQFHLLPQKNLGWRERSFCSTQDHRPIVPASLRSLEHIPSSAVLEGHSIKVGISATSLVLVVRGIQLSRAVS